MGDERVPYRLAKRVLDKGVAAGLGVALAPVFAVVLGAMGVDMLRDRRDRGPLLYRERRISRGREFDLLKFRTLRGDVLARDPGGEAHARLLEADESNLTWAGRRVLKPWYLDELPQLWNVVRGEMSMVGPPMRNTLSPWCKVCHQSTENLMIGMLTKPTTARIAAARAPRVGSSNAFASAM